MILMNNHFYNKHIDCQYASVFLNYQKFSINKEYN